MSYAGLTRGRGSHIPRTKTGLVKPLSLSVQKAGKPKKAQ